MSSTDQLLVPALRFPEFSEDWGNNKLGSLCEIKTGNKDTKNKVENGIYPFFVRSDNVERINSYSFDGEAILTSGDGVGVGKNFHYFVGKFDFHQRVYCLRNFKPYISGRFIYEIFSERFYRRVVRLSAKNSVDSVRMDMISKMEIPIPSLKEQQKIAAFLSSVDTKIEQLKKKKALWEQYKKGMMQKLFSQEIRFKDENGNDYPNWDTKKLGDVAGFRNGKAHEQSIKQDGKYIVVNSKFISSDGVVKKYSDEQICPLFSSDVVMVMSDVPCGKALAKCYLIERNDLYSLNQRICALTSNYIDPFFLYKVISRNKYYLKFDTKVSQTNLRKKEVLKCPIEVPILEEQHKIAKLLINIDKKVEFIDTEIKQAQTFKKGLLQQMFV